ncbi:hypothetical protein D3C71_1769190 [compost metagenome]
MFRFGHSGICLFGEEEGLKPIRDPTGGSMGVQAMFGDNKFKIGHYFSLQSF